MSARDADLCKRKKQCAPLTDSKECLCKSSRPERTRGMGGRLTLRCVDILLKSPGGFSSESSSSGDKSSKESGISSSEQDHSNGCLQQVRCRRRHGKRRLMDHDRLRLPRIEMNRKVRWETQDHRSENVKLKLGDLRSLTYLTADRPGCQPALSSGNLKDKWISWVFRHRSI